MNSAKRHALYRLGSTLVAALALPLLALGAEPAADPGAPALAERLCDTARLTLGTKYLVEPRFSRLWADAMLQAGDTDGAIKALSAYVLYESDDKPALIQLVDLYANNY